MDTCRRSYLVLIFFLLVLTGYGQNFRGTTFTATTGMTTAVMRATSSAFFHGPFQGTNMYLASATNLFGGSGFGLSNRMYFEQTAADRGGMKETLGRSIFTVRYGAVSSNGVYFGDSNPLNGFEFTSFQVRGTNDAGDVNADPRHVFAFGNNFDEENVYRLRPYDLQYGTLVRNGYVFSLYDGNFHLSTNDVPTYLDGLTITQTGPTTFTKTSTNQLGARFDGTTPLTMNSPLDVNGAFAIPRYTNALLAVDVTTNLYSFFNFPSNTTVTFSGTARTGTRLQVDILNTNTTNVTITFPSAKSVSQGLAAVTTVTVGTNSQASLYFYRIGTGEWQFRSEGKDTFSTQFLNPVATQVLGIGAVVDNTAILTNTGVTIDSSSNVGIPATAGVNTLFVTNNIAYLSADINPTGNATNFQADFNFAWRTCLMTNAVSVTGGVNIAAANINKPWLLKCRNYSGSALRLRVAAAMRRSGTNDVSVANNQAADVLITPDGTGGVNETNLHAQITIYDSP